MARKKLWYQFSYKIKGNVFFRYANGYKNKVEMESMLKKKGVSFSVLSASLKPFEYKPHK